MRLSAAIKRAISWRAFFVSSPSTTTGGATTLVFSLAAMCLPEVGEVAT